MASAFIRLDRESQGDLIGQPIPAHDTERDFPSAGPHGRTRNRPRRLKLEAFRQLSVIDRPGVLAV